MARKKTAHGKSARPRKHFNSDEIRLLSEARFLPASERNKPLPQETRERHLVALLASLHDLRTGQTTAEHAYSLQAQLNETLKVFEAGLYEEGADHLEICRRARGAMLSVIQRSRSSGCMQATESEMLMIQDFVDLRTALLNDPAYTIGVSLDARRQVLLAWKSGNFIRDIGTCEVTSHA